MPKEILETESPNKRFESYPDKLHSEDSIINNGMVKDNTQNTQLQAMKTRMSLDLDKFKSFIQEDRTGSLVDKIEMMSDDHPDTKNKSRVKPRCIFRAHNRMRMRWEILVLLLAIWNGFSIPYNVAFYGTDEDYKWTIFNAILDFLFFLDVIVNFRTTYIDEKTSEEIFEPCMIAQQYLKGRFWVDIIASIPFDNIAEFIIQSDDNSTALQIFGLIKLVRILRLSRLMTFMNLKDDVQMTFKLIRLIFFITLYLHFIACMWFF